MGETRREHLIRFYSIVDELERNIGGARTLGNCRGRMDWPARGVYFFREAGENRNQTKAILPMTSLTARSRSISPALMSFVGAHDLRRTCARLCHVAGGELEQIQFLLGHVSIPTTERYLGCKQRIQSAVNDKVGIEPPG